MAFTAACSACFTSRQGFSLQFARACGSGGRHSPRPSRSAAPQVAGLDAGVVTLHLAHIRCGGWTSPPAPAGIRGCHAPYRRLHGDGSLCRVQLIAALSDLRTAFFSSGAARSASENCKREEGRSLAASPSGRCRAACAAPFSPVGVPGVPPPRPPPGSMPLPFHPQKNNPAPGDGLKYGWPRRSPVHRNGPVTGHLLGLLLGGFPFLHLSVTSSIGADAGARPGLNRRDIVKNGIGLGRADCVAQGFQAQGPVLRVISYAGDICGFLSPEDTAVHPFGKPMSHSTQSGFSAAFSTGAAPGGSPGPTVAGRGLALEGRGFQGGAVALRRAASGRTPPPKAQAPDRPIPVPLAEDPIVRQVHIQVCRVPAGGFVGGKGVGNISRDDKSSLALMPCADAASRKYEWENSVSRFCQVKNRFVEPILMKPATFSPSTQRAAVRQ